MKSIYYHGFRRKPVRSVYRTYLSDVLAAVVLVVMLGIFILIAGVMYQPVSV